MVERQNIFPEGLSKRVVKGQLLYAPVVTVVPGKIVFLSGILSRNSKGEIVGKGDNMPIAGLIPIIAFFTYLSLNEAFRHDRLIQQGREDEVLDEMYK